VLFYAPCRFVDKSVGKASTLRAYGAAWMPARVKYIAQQLFVFRRQRGVGAHLTRVLVSHREVLAGTLYAHAFGVGAFSTCNGAGCN
jgi:hypothetical protein